MVHTCNLYFAMIFEWEELDPRGRQAVLHLQFCSDSITASTIFKKISILSGHENLVFILAFVEDEIEIERDRER